jgi:hypothetical protein
MAIERRQRDDDQPVSCGARLRPGRRPRPQSRARRADRARDLGKITKYEDYEIAWGERLPDPNVPDRFPHSEGWTVEALGPGRCLLRNRLRGRHLFPLSDAIGKELWDALIPSVLDNDLQDVALAVGAIERTQHVEVPRLAMILHLLSRAKEIDGVPATEFFAH